MSGQNQIDIPKEALANFCRRHRVRRLWLFGSILRDDFRPDSDIDVLVEYEPDARRTLSDLLAQEAELAALFARKVDLVEEQCLRNPFRRHHILRTRQVIYGP